MKRSRNRRTSRNRSKKLIRGMMRGGVCPTCVASVGFGVGKYMIGAAGVASVAGASAVSTRNNRSKRRNRGGSKKKNSFQKKKKKGGSRKRKRNTRRTKKR